MVTITRRIHAVQRNGVANTRCLDAAGNALGGKSEIRDRIVILRVVRSVEVVPNFAAVGTPELSNPLYYL